MLEFSWISFATQVVHIKFLVLEAINHLKELHSFLSRISFWQRAPKSSIPKKNCVFIWICDSFEVRNERKRWRRIVNIRIHLMTQCVRIYVRTGKVNTPSNAKRHTIKRQINDSSDQFGRNECSNCLIRRTITKHFGALYISNRK